MKQYILPSFSNLATFCELYFKDNPEAFDKFRQMCGRIDAMTNGTPGQLLYNRPTVVGLELVAPVPFFCEPREGYQMMMRIEELKIFMGGEPYDDDPETIHEITTNPSVVIEHFFKDAFAHLLGMNIYSHSTDRAGFHYINSPVGEGVYLAVTKKYLPDFYVKVRLSLYRKIHHEDKLSVAELLDNNLGKDLSTWFGVHKKSTALLPLTDKQIGEFAEQARKEKQPKS